MENYNFKMHFYHLLSNEESALVSFKNLSDGDKTLLNINVDVNFSLEEIKDIKKVQNKLKDFIYAGYLLYGLNF